MLQFQPLTLAQYSHLRGYFKDNPHRTCDYTAGTTFLWRRFFHTSYVTVGDTLLLRARYFDGAPLYTMPIGADPRGALSILREDCRARGETLRFCFTAAEDVPVLQGIFATAEVTEEADWADYLYDRTAFVSLTGKKYHGQRNFVNRFGKLYPDALLLPITAARIPAVRAFVCRQYAQNPDRDSMAAAEHEAILELLENYDLYGMDGAVLTVEEKIVGLTVGETVGDTLYVHVEKGDTAYAGVYPKLATAYAASVTNPDVRYINREEDMGDAGLRRAKQSWHPLRLVPKYTVVIKE
ncbi:MAG: DUF2156 domain-containing protein [Clostridia bacterium]|nr:DUF2156 domain-containing protein [Clostridia bacterium]